MGTKLQALVLTMRPRQWIKNLIMYAALFFSGHMFELTLFLRASAAFVVFCLLSGAVYMVNDVLDIEEDRRHPDKSRRPLASGQIHVPEVLLVGCALVGISLGGAAALSLEFGATALLYLTLMVLYSLILKRRILVDIFVISLGFVLRAISGALVIGVGISSWLLICTFFLALFLALGKRRSELAGTGERANKQRAVLERYSLPFLDQLLGIVTAGTLLAYALYTMDQEGKPTLPLTALVVIYGLFRYLYLLYEEGKGESPEDIIFEDRALQVSIALWMLSLVWIFYR